MVKYVFSRADIEAIADRLDAKAWSSLFLDMPETRRDIRSAAAILRCILSLGVPVTTIQVDVLNGTLP